MDSLRGLLLTLFAWILFGTAGLWFLSQELKLQVHTEGTTQEQVAAAPYEGTPTDLSRISGEQAVGLVPPAASGEYTLILPDVINGTDIIIDRATDLWTIDLKDVPLPGVVYRMEVARSTQGEITEIRLTQEGGP